MIKIRRLSYKKQEHQILAIENFDIANAGFYVIVGDSGSGKTTLLHAISGFLPDYEGEVIINNYNIKDITPKEHARFLRTTVSLSFQHFVFINDLTVRDNIGLALESYGDRNHFRNDKVVNDIAVKLNIEPLLNKKVRYLSGGEKARVNIARTLLKDTQIYLFDEPTAMLDYENSVAVMNILKEKSRNHIIIVVTHDRNLAQKYADKIISLRYGKVANEQLINVRNEKVYRRSKDKALQNNSERIASSLFKAWKNRNFIASFSANFGLMGIGLSLLLVNSLNFKLSNALKGSFHEQTTYVTNERNHDYSVIKTIEEDDIKYLERNHNFSFGSVFVTNLDEIFTARNEVVFYQNNFKHVLPSFHANLFNEVIFLSEVNDEMFPYVDELAADEIILDLPIDDFRVLLTAFKLPYRNNAQELGAYLANNIIQLILRVGNYDWDYFDEQIFRLKAVRLKSKARVITSSLRFAEQLFIHKMRLISSNNLTKIEQYPWVLKKIVFIFTSKRDELLYAAETFPDYIMQTANNQFFRSLNEDEILKKRILVFQAPPYFYEFFTFIQQNNVQHNYLYTSPYFRFIDQLLLIGFTMNFFVSNDALLLTQIAREDIENKEVSHVQLNIPSNVLNLSLQNSGFGALSFKSINTAFKIDEIVISSGAAERIFGHSNVKNEVLHVQALTVITNKSGVYEKKYETVQLTIIDIIEDENIIFYQHHLWQYLLFKDVFNISPFTFSIDGILIDDDVKLNYSENVVMTKPFIAYSALIKDALRNIESYSLFVSSTAFVISFFIVIMVLFYLFNEAYPSLNNLNLIGYDQKAIKKIVLYYVTIFFFKLYITLILELFFLSFVIEVVLSNYFKTKFMYVFMPKSYVVVTLLLIVLLSAISIFFAFVFKTERALTFSRRDL